jgi:hypothetical protein
MLLIWLCRGAERLSMDHLIRRRLEPFAKRTQLRCGFDDLSGGFVRRQSLFSSAGLSADVATAIYIAVVAVIAQGTGLFLVFFPELGALSHDIMRRPQGTWATAPVLLVVTPFLAAVVGTLVTKHLAFGLVSVLLTVGCSILIIRLLKSPIVPAISAGLLPLTLGLSNWWYPPSLLVGTGLLAGVAEVRNRIVLVTEETSSIRDQVPRGRDPDGQPDGMAVYPVPAAGGNCVRDVRACDGLSLGRAPLGDAISYSSPAEVRFSAVDGFP